MLPISSTLIRSANHEPTYSFARANTMPVGSEPIVATTSSVPAPSTMANAVKAYSPPMSRIAK